MSRKDEETTRVVVTEGVVSYRQLLIDPRSRKVVIVEHPLLTMAAKDALVRVLFMNLGVSCLSFSSISS